MPGSYITSIAADGRWCPMAHCNRLDDSLHDLEPLRSVQNLQTVPDPAFGGIGLGAFTAQTFAVCSFEAADRPALVAFDYEDGSILWTSPLEDLPAHNRLRWVAGVLIANVSIDGGPSRRCVFAANPFEFVAYDERGSLLWKTPLTDLIPGSAAECGMPRSITYTSSDLVVATTRGWILKVSAVDGRPVDAYRLITSANVDGELTNGFLSSVQSPVIIGSTLYMVVNFVPGHTGARAQWNSPVFMVRVNLDQPGVRGPSTTIHPVHIPKSSNERSPDRVEIGIYGFRRYGGSPCGLVAGDGKPVIFGNAMQLVDNQPRSVVVAVEDDEGVLKVRSRSALSMRHGDVVPAAPALHGPSGHYLVPTIDGLHVFHDVSRLAGSIPSPTPIPARSLVTPVVAAHASQVRLTSPIALAVDHEAEELVAYTNVRVSPNGGWEDHSFMAAFALPLSGSGAPKPLWCEPLALTASGAPAPGAGTFGQPALFRYAVGTETKTGVITNTCGNGTFIFR